ncbi:U-box domain-containing protein 35-like [Bidens hawaiensis]|uniref:U-box domain-containing protein 35-like n=1 Tax=Bidens hawaiensis TaxID=980011 RepID=UPI00404A12EB
MNNKTVAVAIDRDKGSQGALKWSLDNLVRKGQTVYLIHVRIKQSFTFSQSNISSTLDIYIHNTCIQDYSSGFKCCAEPTRSSESSDFIEDSFMIDTDAQLRELYLPFRCFCTRKEIRSRDVLLEDTDVVKGLVDFVTRSIVEVLIIGTPSKGGLLKRFKTRDVPGTILKTVPSFCTVYVISKGKISATKAASRRPPYESPLRTLGPPEPSSMPSNALSEKTLPMMPMPRMSIDSSFPRRSTDSSFKSPFTSRRRPNGKSYGELLPPESDISFVSSGRMSVDNVLPPYESELSPVHSRMSFSELDNQGFDSHQGRRSVDVTFSTFDSPPRSSSAVLIRRCEAEMRRLKLELSRTMEMYSTACREALTARQKAMELQKWKLAEEQKAEDLRVAEESENENTKSTGTSFSQYDSRYRRYTIEEIEEATEYFSTERRIGEGGYGPVYKCHLDHTRVAVKVLRPNAAEGKAQFQQEVEVLCCIRHPHMVLLLGACPEYGCLVYEYMQNGSLEDCLFRKNKIPPLSWQHRFRIAAEICSGLLFLHQTKLEPIVHRDLKPANILLDRNFVSKISDVGLARLLPPSVQDSVTQSLMTSTAGTFCYIDPEYQQTGMLGVKSDVYSLGIMFLQMITAKPPMGLTHIIDQAIKDGTFAELLDPGVPDWPIDEALCFAKLSLLCTELRQKDRPDLGKEIMPELERLRSLADESMQHSVFASSPSSVN